MYLNVTQKSRDLFRDYPVVRSTDRAQAAALANPLFSWHVTTVMAHHQRLLLFGHDASALCVVVDAANVTATQRLADQFWDQLAQQWPQYGLQSANLKAYRQTAGSWQINAPIVHQHVRRLNEQGMYASFLLDQGITIPLELDLLVAKTPPLGRQQPPHVVANIAADLAVQGNHWRDPKG